MIKYTSAFKNPDQDLRTFNSWVAALEKANNRTYTRHTLHTTLGKTHVWGWSTSSKSDLKLVIFPGARTTSLFWDFDRGLDYLGADVNVYLVETNGLPNLSDGSTPDIKSMDYGHWASDVLDQLGIASAFIAGASFGGLLCMKLAATHPEKVKAAFLLNPGCLQPFSLSFKNLYYNLLPIFKPTARNVEKFLSAAIFSKPNHQVSAVAEKLLIDYEVLALTRYQDRTQKPYYMGKELEQVVVPTYLLLGDQDLLFPYKKSIENAKKHLKNLKDMRVFHNVGHGIETYADAIRYVREKMENL